jgi:hypothetical protein
VCHVDIYIEKSKSYEVVGFYRSITRREVVWNRRFGTTLCHVVTHKMEEFGIIVVEKVATKMVSFIENIFKIFKVFDCLLSLFISAWQQILRAEN